LPASEEIVFIMALQTRSKIRLGVAVILLAMTAVFVILNMEPVEVNLVFAKVQMKLALLIIFVLLLGFLLGWLFKSLLRMRPASKEKGKATANAGASSASDLDS
jgi:uncharacterized integral membrane protein